MATRSHRSPSSASGRRRAALGAAVAAVAVALVAALIVAFGPDHGSTAGPAGATSVAEARATPTATTPAAEPTTASPSASASASPSPSSRRSAPAAAGSAPSRAAATPAAEPARKASGSAPLAGRIKPGVSYEGVATFYDVGNGDGACLYGPTTDVMTAAMNTTDYETSKACGAYILVRAASGASVTVRITNECPLPCAPGQLDLSPQAFAKLAAPVTGRIPITWSLLSPSTSDTISIRYKTGSTRYWCGIQAIGHRNPLARLEVRTASGWSELPRTDYNYFLSEQGSGCGGAIRLTDIYGERMEITGIAVRPDVAQSTGMQFARH
ncbi:expansin EXLX1 family cellulose-binding protein [Streptomyces griseorubiginosus]|uniref:expansin EXLX1 family cellulose-binding protein n=1 Tax=Streptomyces griseorubiginosus TaxID=67304 RepID=UPI003686E9F7